MKNSFIDGSVIVVMFLVFIVLLVSCSGCAVAPETITVPMETSVSWTQIGDDNQLNVEVTVYGKRPTGIYVSYSDMAHAKSVPATWEKKSDGAYSTSILVNNANMLVVIKVQGEKDLVISISPDIVQEPHGVPLS